MIGSEVGMRGRSSPSLRKRAALRWVELLLEHGADPNLADGASGHAFNRALLAGRPDLATILLARGSDPAVLVPIGTVPPIVLASYSEYGDTSIARSLMGRGVDVNATNELGESAVTWARRRANAQLVDLLRSGGARVGEDRDKEKEVPWRRIALDSENPSRLLSDSIRRSLSLLQRSSDAFLRNRSYCVSCHHQNLPSVALGWARDRGFAIDENSVQVMIDRQVEEWRGGIDAAYEMENPVGTFVPRLLGWGLLGFSALGYPPDELTDAMVWYLTETQRPEGHWVSGISRPPMGGGSILSTVLALRALQLYSLDGPDDSWAGSVRRARTWLLRAKPRIFQERVFRLLGLGWTGSSPDDLAELTAEILSYQRDDGGWAQLSDLSSDAWATGQTLVALALTGGVSTSHPAYRRGLQFLLQTEFDDGSWFVKTRTWPSQTFFDSRFPHGRDQWISAAATAWATMAMLLATPTPPGARTATDGERAGAADSLVEGSARPEATIDFSKDIRPVLERSCLPCHEGKRPAAKLSMESRTALVRGGESGAPAVVAGQPDESPLFLHPAGRVEDMEMPPIAKREKFPALDAKELDALRAWILEGARWPADSTD